MKAIRHQGFASAAIAMVVFVSSAKGAIITGESATATGTYADPNRNPNLAVNDAGLSAYNPMTTDLAVNGSITHGSTPNQPTSWFVLDGSAVGDSITINLGQLYDIGGMRIWNWNESDSIYLGIKNYDLETSPTGLSGTWTPRQSGQGLDPASGTNSYAGEYFGGLNWTNVQYVKITIVHTYTHPTFGADAYGGLSEVMFATVPEPPASLLIGIASLIMNRSVMRRQRAAARW